MEQHDDKILAESRSIWDTNAEAWDKILISATFAALKRGLAENDSRANKEIH